MKGKFKYIIIVFVLIALVACDSAVDNPEEIRIGLIETTGSKKKSNIHWYDENLEEVYVQNLRYAGLGSIFSGRPVYFDNDMFLIPEGYMQKKDEKKVISIDKREFKITEYDVPNIGLQDLAVTDKYIFVNSNLNQQTHISRVDRGNNEFSEQIYQGAYFDSILGVEDKIFMFGDMDVESGGSYVYIIDEDFNLEKTIDLNEIGRGAYKFLLDGDDLYFSLYSKIDDSPNTLLVKLNIDTYEIETIDLDLAYLDSITKYDNKLLISHNDLVIGEGSVLSILDLENNSIIRHDAKLNLCFVEIYKDSLIVSDGEKISLLDIKDDFKMTKQIDIDKSDDTHISNLIVID